MNIKRLIGALLLIYSLCVIIRLALKADENFWDFRIYYYSIECLKQGLTPYDTQNLSMMAGHECVLPFVYPPLTLKFFGIFHHKNIKTASVLFLIFKIILLVFLIYLWRKLQGGGDDLLLYVFILLAFNATLYLDLRAGNISVVIQFLLWFGIYFYLKKKYVLFGTLVLSAAAFKLLPIGLLLLFVFTKEKKKYVYLVLFSTLFAGYLLLNYMFYPVLYVEFMRSASGVLDERGIINPALYRFIKDFSETIVGGRFCSNTTCLFETVCYGITITIVCMVSYKSIKNMSVEGNVLYEEREYLMVFLFCFTYSFIVPRFKDYDYILLILPAYYIMNKSGFIKPIYAVLFICGISSINITLPGVKLLYHSMWDYYPLFLAMFLWSLYIFYINKSLSQHKHEDCISQAARHYADKQLHRKGFASNKPHTGSEERQSYT